MGVRPCVYIYKYSYSAAASREGLVSQKLEGWRRRSRSSRAREQRMSRSYPTRAQPSKLRELPTPAQSSTSRPPWLAPESCPSRPPWRSSASFPGSFSSSSWRWRWRWPWSSCSGTLTSASPILTLAWWPSPLGALGPYLCSFLWSFQTLVASSFTLS